jgi:hypothetical protein
MNVVDHYMVCREKKVNGMLIWKKVKVRNLFPLYQINRNLS